MELIASVSKIMKHPRKIHFTRSTKAKSVNNNRKNYVSIKSNRFHKSTSFINSLKLHKNKSQEDEKKFITNHEIENKLFNRNYTPSSLESSLPLKTQDEYKYFNNNDTDSESLQQSVLGEFTR